MSALPNYVGFQTIRCVACSVAFCIPDELYRQRSRDRLDFWCPNGHGQHFTGKSADQLRIEELERQLSSAKSDAEIQRNSRRWAERRARGANVKAGKAKAQLRRTIERVHAGVCPHCHRTFKQLAAHMKVKHPQETAK